jgi:hypothetical protein
MGPKDFSVAQDEISGFHELFLKCSLAWQARPSWGCLDNLQETSIFGFNMVQPIQWDEGQVPTSYNLLDDALGEFHDQAVIRGAIVGRIHLLASLPRTGASRASAEQSPVDQISVAHSQL